MWKVFCTEIYFVVINVKLIRDSVYFHASCSCVLIITPEQKFFCQLLGNWWEPLRYSHPTNFSIVGWEKRSGSHRHKACKKNGTKSPVFLNFFTPAPLLLWSFLRKLLRR